MAGTYWEHFTSSFTPHDLGFILTYIVSLTVVPTFQLRKLRPRDTVAHLSNKNTGVSVKFDLQMINEYIFLV